MREVADTMDELAIHGLSSTGEGVGRLADGRVVFVDRALPGDRVRVQLVATRKKIVYATILEVIEPSPERVPPRCRTERCGGCPLRALSFKGQAATKRTTVLEAMRRIGGIDVTGLAAVLQAPASSLHVRHRVRLHAAHIDHHWQLGYFERRSHRVVPLIACPILWPELERAALELAQAVRELPRALAIETAEVAFSRCDGRGGAVLHVKGSPELARPLADVRSTSLSGIEVQSGEVRWRHGNLELRYDHRAAGEFDLRYEPGVFTQACPELNDVLVGRVLEAVRPQQHPRVAEFHAGIGNFSLPLARHGAKVVAIEANTRATSLCQRNARAAGLAIEVINESDEAAAGRIADADVVLLDPPRAGALELAHALAARGPKRVVYVSCDPATLARDVRILRGGGYELRQLEPFDLFPDTSHVETLAVLERSG